MAISMLKIRRPLGRLIFNMGIAIPGKTVFLIETAPWAPLHYHGAWEASGTIGIHTRHINHVYEQKSTTSGMVNFLTNIWLFMSRSPLTDLQDHFIQWKPLNFDNLLWSLLLYLHWSVCTVYLLACFRQNSMLMDPVVMHIIDIAL